MKTVILLLLILVISCGKKATESKSPTPPERKTDAVKTPLEEFLEKQEIACAEGANCPNNIAKIVVLDGDKVKYCTGFLVARDIVATSSSCLPEILRQNDQKCEKDVFFYFPNNFSPHAVRGYCKKVVMASSVVDGVDPVLRSDDLSYLELASPVHLIDSFEFGPREGFQSFKKYTVWSVEKASETAGIIKQHECEAVHGSYLDPFASTTLSPKMLFTKCELGEGSTGAPIVDLHKGKVLGIVSAESDPEVREYPFKKGLVEKPLPLMFHATSFACAPTIFDHLVADERECTKRMDLETLESLRGSIFSPDTLLSAVVKKISEKLNANKYVQFKVEIKTKDDVNTTQVTPICFKNHSEWLNGINNRRGKPFDSNVEIKQMVFKNKMDGYGRFVVNEQTNKNEVFTMRFYPRTLANFEEASVYLYNKNADLEYEDISFCKN